jgi:undecaprenyl-diphosphatase
MALAFLSWDKKWTHKLEHLAQRKIWWKRVGLAGAVWALPVLIVVGIVFQDMSWQVWLGYGFSLVLVWLATVALEFIFWRPRPFDAEKILPLMRPLWDTPSFPSGHAALAWATIMLLGAVEPWMGWMTVPVAIWICLSRVLVGVHYLGDVLAGAVFGLGAGWILTLIFL